MKKILLIIAVLVLALSWIGCSHPTGGNDNSTVTTENNATVSGNDSENGGENNSGGNDNSTVTTENNGTVSGNDSENGGENNSGGNGGEENGEVVITELTSEHYPKDWYCVYDGNEYPIVKYAFNGDGYQTFDDFDSLPTNHMVAFKTTINEETGFKLELHVRRDGDIITHNDSLSTGSYGRTYAISKIIEKDDNIYFYWVFVKENNGE